MYKVMNEKYIICTAKQNLKKDLFMTCKIMKNTHFAYKIYKKH